MIPCQWLLKQHNGHSINHAVTILPFIAWDHLHPLLQLFLLILWRPTDSQVMKHEKCNHHSARAIYNGASTHPCPLCNCFNRGSISIMAKPEHHNCQLYVYWTLWGVCVIEETRWVSIISSKLSNVLAETRRLCWKHFGSWNLKSISTKSNQEHLSTKWGLRTWVSVIICNRSAVIPKMMVHSSSVSVASANIEPSEPDDEVPVEAVELEARARGWQRGWIQVRLRLGWAWVGWLHIVCVLARYFIQIFQNLLNEQLAFGNGGHKRK